MLAQLTRTLRVASTSNCLNIHLRGAATINEKMATNSATSSSPVAAPNGKGSARNGLGRHFHRQVFDLYASWFKIICYYCTESSDVVRSAVQLVLKDEGFKIPSASAKAAVKTAEKLLEWCSQEENSQEFEHFATDLIQELDSCFKSCCRCLKRSRELMWKHLFQARSSAEFRSKWSSFLSSRIGVSASPIFYQFVVDSVFNTLLKEHHRIDIPEEDDIEASLNYEEKNALRYTAGLVRWLKDRF